MKARNGFTLIELLIVVAIIAILAAIAIPNFLEAQVRSKVSRTRTDMRSLAVALEAYATDWNDYPPERGNMNNPQNLVPLSTPVAYITNPLLIDPFKITPYQGSNRWELNVYAYFPMWVGIQRGQKFTRPGAFPLVLGHDLKNTNPFNPAPFIWVMAGYGPDMVLQFDDDPRIPNPQVGINQNIYMPYDPTNGTVSEGDIHRLGP